VWVVNIASVTGKGVGSETWGVLWLRGGCRNVDERSGRWAEALRHSGERPTPLQL